MATSDKLIQPLKELSYPRQEPDQLRLYRTALVQKREKMKGGSCKMLAMKLIAPVQTEQALPIVIVRKRNKTLRFRIDYGKLKAVITMDSYLLPQMDEQIDSFGGSSILFTLDANSGCWQTGAHKTDRKNIVLTSHHALF